MAEQKRTSEAELPDQANKKIQRIIETQSAPKFETFKQWRNWKRKVSAKIRETFW